MTARVLIRMPAHHLYIQQGFGLARAFRRQSVDCHVLFAAMSDEDETAFLDEVRPDILLTVNGMESRATQRYPFDVRINWYQDAFYGEQDFGGSVGGARSKSQRIDYIVSERLSRYLIRSGEISPQVLMFAAEPAPSIADPASVS